MREFIALLFATSLFGQDTALARLKHEMAVAREARKVHRQQKQPAHDDSSQINNVHAALQDWLEPRLSKDVYSLASEYPRLQPSVQNALVENGLSKLGATNSDVDLFHIGYFDEVGFEFKMMPELPNVLFVVAEVNVGCGRDQAVYAYRFDGNGRASVMTDHPKSDWGYGSVKIALSDPDAQGGRLLLIHRRSIQCGSSYRYRMDAVSDSEFQGCPGEGSPSDKHPWLSAEQLKALP